MTLWIMSFFNRRFGSCIIKYTIRKKYFPLLVFVFSNDVSELESHCLPVRQSATCMSGIDNFCSDCILQVTRITWYIQLKL